MIKIYIQSTSTAPQAKAPQPTVLQPTVPQEVEHYRTFLIASYNRIHVTKDQWPPVRFQEYIKLATVVKLEDFMEEDDCTKAMMNGNLEIIKRMKQPIEMEQVSQMYRIISIHCEINFMSADWQVRGWYIG